MLYKLLVSREGVLCFIFLILQQLIVCSSTVWLTQLVISVQSGQNVWWYLALFLLSLSLPYFPGALATMMLSQWRQMTIGKYIEAFITRNRNNVSVWTQQKTKEKHTAFLTSEGQEVLKGTLTYAYDLCTTGLNVGLNILVLSVIVESKYAIGYVIGLFVAGILFKFQRNKQKEFAGHAQASRVSLSQILFSAWDNIVIGNLYNFNLWHKETARRFKTSQKSNVRAEVFQSFISIGIALSTFLPLVAIIVLHVSSHIHDSIALSVFVVTLPRLFVVLNFTYDLLYLLFQWTTYQEKLAGVGQSLIELPREPLEERIQWPKIKFHEREILHTIHSIDALMSFTNSPGRLTIRGENGTGKSTILTLLKGKLGDKAFYLPPKGDLFFQKDTTQLSGGQAAKSHLEELKEYVPERILLLDEWDANLDTMMREHLSHLIDTLCQDKVVIEVRHFEDHPHQANVLSSRIEFQSTTL